MTEELETVRGWLRMLSGSSHPRLKELSARCEALVQSADEAVAATALKLGIPFISKAW